MIIGLLGLHQDKVLVYYVVGDFFCDSFLFLFYFSSYNFRCVKLLTIYYLVHVSFLV
jgi:hypothetical protein